ncbi:helix-turn-helix domain-containing protein [Rummeliibacillus suwonensis]|uniref:helix-turn-helix domain-containing protein n=1 Tax=Rummeliibacillus suwonensis TaxID=1306154 RepID=UPI0011B7566E|nr:helix-turn-helix transcriptional regulator [Rummeliibacillus suwonensis]
MSSLGTRIRKLREQYNISQKDFAKKINVSNVVLSRYESDERKPDYDTLEKIADYFEVSVDYLLGRSNTLKQLVNKDDEEFEAFFNDPSLEKWYKELPKTKEEDLRKLRKMWEILKDKSEV